jgi:hypothetical protein
MSEPIVATYSFLPWLRQGIANTIAGTEGARATITVNLKLDGEPVDGGKKIDPLTVKKDVQLFGPGDVVGIESRAFFKTEPHNWITNFEPNYLPYIDFYDEDFPWRYTPAAPDVAKSRLQPWIMLVVLKDAQEEGKDKEFEDGKDIKDKPLPFITVAKPKEVFPSADQLWAWAHVHVNQSLAANNEEVFSTDMDAVLPRLQRVLTENPDLAYSRILCPRKLEPNTAYHAFLIPVFESGRLSGLGLEIPKTLNATASAWADKTAPTDYPYYHRWYFRTGTIGDFEYLVRLLKPKPVDRRVGTRDMDVLHPGSNLPPINVPDLEGILKLGGALQPPSTEQFTPEQKKAFLAKLTPEEKKAVEQVEKSEQWDRNPYPQPFQKALAAFINLADDYAEKTAEDANQAAKTKTGLDLNTPINDDPNDDEIDSDPLITPPLYGRWHSLTQRLLENRQNQPLSPTNNWVHQLNLDPRYRVPAGLGTRVVQENQEQYMDAAWEQIGDVLEANRKMRLAQLAKEVAWIWHTRHLQPLRAASLEKALVFTAPVHKRVVSEGFTVHYQVDNSLVSSAVTSVAMRRIVRPRGRFVQSLPFDDRIQPDNIIDRINNGEVSAAPPKQTPPGVATVDDLSDSLQPKDIPTPVIDILRRFPWLQYLPLILAVLIAILLWLLSLGGIVVAIGGVAIAALIALFRQLQQWTNQIAQADSIREENQTPAAVDKLPKSPDFVLTEPGSSVKPSQGTTDSAEAVRFKDALKDVDVLIGASREIGKLVPKTNLNLATVTDATIQTIDPEIAIPLRMRSIVLLPDRIKNNLGAEFKEAMAYPEIDIAMYEPLKAISTELFLPNVNLVEQNSITLLETNQKFIEAYMVGLNHEFARELLWREYPTDQRGSYFRQFWDVSNVFTPQILSDQKLKDQIKEELRDIPPIHTWSKDSELGEHDNREKNGVQKKDVVLVIRGELLKKYPTAVIYAHRADWIKTNGKIDKIQKRKLLDLQGLAIENISREKVRTPLYQAKVDPDIYFLGFDLTVQEAKGGTGENEADDAGWFFVIKERPGEPRFGLDIDKSDKLHIWNDLSWQDVQLDASGTSIKADQSFSLTTPPSVPNDASPEVKAEAKAKETQYNEDNQVSWNPNTNSADLAYILYQVPVLIAVHASELLPKS